MTDHPRHWLTATLGELGEIRLGRMLDRAKNRGEFRQYLRNINVRWFGFDLSDLSSMRVPQEESEQLSVRDGDLFVCEGGEPGRCAVWRLGENDLVYQKALHRVRPEDGMVPEFLMYQLRHHADTGGLSEAFTGTTIKHLTLQSLAGYEIRIAPTHEQERIADKLDAVLARVDACRERLDRVPNILKRFRQAVLAAATSGKLTEEWRVSQGGVEGAEWELTTIEALLDGKPRNGYSPRAVEHQTPVKSLTLTATTTGRFLPQHFKYIDKEIPEESHLWLRPGDILVQRANTTEYVGVSAVYEGPPNGFIYPDLMMKCRASGRVQTKFLHYLLLSDPVRRHYRENATGTAGNMPKINQRTVLSAPAVLPPLEEQSEIIRRVESLFAYSDRLEARYAAARAQVERLTPALLAKAFRGELVPQDPNDEPASVLLERIRAARAAAPAKPKRDRAVASNRRGKDVAIPGHADGAEPAGAAKPRPVGTHQCKDGGPESMRLRSATR